MEKNNETKNKLLEAACTVFREKGYEKAKVSDIVAMANVAQGTFYLYFKSKNECLNSMSGKLVDSFIDQLYNASEDMDDTSIYRILETILGHIEQHKEIITTIHFEQGNIDDTISEKFNHIHSTFNEIVSKAFLVSGLSEEAAKYKTMLVIAAFEQYMSNRIYVFNPAFINDNTDIREMLNIILNKVKF